MDASNNRNERLISTRPNSYEVDDFHIALMKRIYSQLNIILMFGNTINSIFAITAAISLIPQYNFEDYQFCDWGSPIAIGVECPYTPSPAFIAMISIWTIYFATLFMYHHSRTLTYFTTDLRFYLICEIIGGELYMRILIWLGYLLTIASGLTGVYYAAFNGSTDSLGSIIVFMIVNIMNLRAIGTGNFDNLRGVNLNKLYPEPMWIKLHHAKLNNLYGCALNQVDVISFIQNAVIYSRSKNDELTCVKRIGDPNQLIEVIDFLVPEEIYK